jgi:hypothetical protein
LHHFNTPLLPVAEHDVEAASGKTESSSGQWQNG